MIGRSREARMRDEALLVAFAEHLCAAAAASEPRVAFRDSLRTSLLMEASTALTVRAEPDIWAPPAHRALPRRRLGVATAVIVPSLGMGGMASASASALPGDTLYPVKRGIESTELAFQRGDANRGEFQLELATERLSETTQLVERRDGAGDLAADTLTTYNEQAGDGSASLVRSFKDTGDSGNIVTVNRFSSTAYDSLTSLAGRLEGPAEAALNAAQEQLADIVEMSYRLCPDCGGADAALINALRPAPSGAPEGPAEGPADSTAPRGAAPNAGLPAAGPGGGESGSSDESESDEESEDDEDQSEDDESDDEQTATNERPTPPVTPTPTPTVTHTPMPTPTVTPTPTNTPTPTPTPTCHVDQGNGKSCHTPLPEPPLEEGTPAINKELVQRLLDSLANLISDVE